MNKKIILFFIIGTILILGTVISFTIYNSYKTTIKSDKIQMTASFYPLYFFSQQIGGDKVSVINITPAGIEPHDYDPTVREMAQIINSKIIILNGLIEPWAENVIQNINTENTFIIKTSEGLANQKTIEEGETITDPHIWLSPILSKQMVDKITEGFIKIDQTNEEYYKLNAEKLKNELDNLNEKYRQELSSCQKRDIITSHLAFGYLASAYGLNQVAISGLSPEAEPSPQQLAKVVKFVKDNHIEYIFFESLVSPELSYTIANEVGAKTLILDPIERLTKEEISEGKNYFTQMQQNLDNLKIALQCK